jgi:preprotein translocase subunit SecA
MLENSFEEGDELEHPLLNMSIENAQKKVEQQNFSIRKRLLQYDDVLNKQRQVIYEIRNQAIHSETPREIIDEMVEDEVVNRLEALPPNPIAPENEGELKGIIDWVNTTFPVAIKMEDLTESVPSTAKDNSVSDYFKDCILGKIKDAYDVKASLEDSDSLVQLERYVIIRSIDRHWQDHLTEMEDLRRSVGLRGYGQKDPLNEYKGEAYRYFEELMENVRAEICNGVFRSSTNLEAFQNMLSILNKDVQVEGPSESDSLVGLLQGDAQVQASGGGSDVDLPKPQAEPLQPIRRAMPKVGRNEACPCGSGKKFKKCCG